MSVSKAAVKLDLQFYFFDEPEFLFCYSDVMAFFLICSKSRKVKPHWAPNATNRKSSLSD